MRRRIQDAPDGLPQGFGVALPAHVLNLDNKSRSNLFAWRGQFSPQLVESLLTAYAPRRSVVLDPFMGSGTVLVEGGAMGHEVHGYEVNPAAFCLARLYEFCTLNASARGSILARAESALLEAVPNDLPLFPDSTDGSGVGARGFRNAALECRHDGVRAVLEALVILLDTDRDRGGLTGAWGRWRTIRKTVASLPHAPRPVRAHFGDARCLSLPDACVDFVLSSPPYINVFNYHHNNRPAVESLGWRPLVVARSEIGSNRKFRQNRFLTVVQYCIDIAWALAEIRRVCREGARVLLVVGRESNVHMTPFFNSRILRTVATDLLGFRVVLEQERVFQNRFGQRIFEDLLHLEPTGPTCVNDGHLTRGARELGTAILRDAVDRVPPDRRRFLVEAIARAAEVPPSPVLEPSLARSAITAGVLPT